MKKIEVERYHSGYIIRKFTDVCKKKGCEEKHWILEQVPIEIIKVRNHIEPLSQRVVRILEEWLDE